MSNDKLQREIVKLRNKLPHQSFNKTPIILSDSKGKYLKLQRNLPIESGVRFWYKKGATTRDSYKYLEGQIDEAVRHYNNIVFYVWLGTCDLTDFNHKNRHISLRSRDSSSVNYVINNFRRIYALVATYKTVELVFLEIPVYSIVCWNKYQGHKYSEQFQNDDLKLEEQINTANSFIRETNLILRKHSPKFSCDLQNSRKCSQMRNSRFSYKFNAFDLDGIHPTSLLSKLWLLRIVALIVVDCA
ncbi:unnamed protein product [Mytilus coruscus]|uniref:Uncharacterized protein n=1 Tax=Mytilus coruscus TaxID=42192 RepID=A0A6J8BB86_MYTCO|nr:unnamed protein product [Mytilus coruscus]